MPNDPDTEPTQSRVSAPIGQSEHRTGEGSPTPPKRKGPPRPHQPADAAARARAAQAALAELPEECPPGAPADAVAPAAPGRSREELAKDAGNILRAAWLGVGLVRTRKTGRLPDVGAARRWSARLGDALAARLEARLAHAGWFELVGLGAEFGADLLESFCGELAQVIAQEPRPS